MFDNIKSKAASTARRTAFGLAAGMAMLVGLFFLTLAAWIVLVNVADSLTAAIVLGAVYMGIGLILLAFALTRRNEPPVYHEALRSTSQRASDPAFKGVAAAFFEGLGAGLTARDQFLRSRGAGARNGSDRS